MSDRPNLDPPASDDELLDYAGDPVDAEPELRVRAYLDQLPDDGGAVEIPRERWDFVGFRLVHERDAEREIAGSRVSHEFGIEVTVRDDTTIEIRSSGIGASQDLVVLPQSPNIIRITAERRRR